MNIPHTPLMLKRIGELVVHRIVESSTLITGHIFGVTVEDLTDGEYPGRLSVLGPELLGYLWGGIDSNTVESIRRYSVVYPTLECGSDE